MTDEENQRQRHLAEMMIAECDGKQLQARFFATAMAGAWDLVTDDYAGLVPCVLANIKTWTKGLMQIRIKPEPREWCLCLTCHRWCPKGFELSHPDCHGEKVKVREVLND